MVLSPPAAPERVLEARIDEIKPTLGANNRALDAIVKIRGEGTLFRGGGTVNARIVTSALDGALMVPEQSVVLRPAGKVVYALENGVARQRVVETGMRQDGMQQIIKGVNAGETRGRRRRRLPHRRRRGHGARRARRREGRRGESQGREAATGG